MKGSETGVPKCAPPIRQGALAPPDDLVTLANWQSPPWNRWAFQHVRQLVPTALVPRGRERPSPLPARPVDLDELPVETSVGTEPLHSLLKRSYTDGFLVLHEGTIVTEQYFTSMTPATRHILQSVSKSLTGMLAGVLAGDGLLDPAAQVTGYVPELSGSSFDGATVRQVLDMTTGTRFSEDYTDPQSDIVLFQNAVGWRPLIEGTARVDTLSYLQTTANERAHGEVFDYRSILTNLLGIIVERAGGLPFAEALGKRIWSPMGAESDAEVTLDRHGFAIAAGGVSATLRDVGRVGRLLADGGRCGDVQVVPTAWIDDTRYADEACRTAFMGSEEASKLAICEPSALVCRPKGHYRNHWWVPDPERGILLASGIFGQSLYVDLPRQVVVAKLSSLPVAFDADIATDLVRAGDAIAEALNVSRKRERLDGGVSLGGGE